jgi:histidyl-tRNA synthetase
MRDFLPARMILRQYVVGVLREVFERFGFEPLETPAIEYAETLEGKFGDEADKLIYRFEDRGGRRVGLRYDLTVPLARVVAMYPELVKPFKRYQIAPVWRAEKPQKGRYREFYQCDVDVVGSASMLADAEVVAVADFALVRLGFSRYRIKLNDRKILTALGQYAGVPAESLGGIYRAIDKLEKVGAEAVHGELASQGIPADTIARLLDLVQVQGEPAGVFAQLRERLAAVPRGAEGVGELEQVVTYLEELGIGPERYQVDLSMVRGLEYYTGPIFEAVVEEPRIGSICGGGRYDNLVGTFSGQSHPAVGISVGLERIIDVLEELGLVEGRLRQTTTAVLVTVFGPETRAASLALVGDLRRAGINAEVFLGLEKLPNQLRYASRKGIPFVAILGPDEVAKDVVLVKEMATGEQRGYERATVGSAFLALLRPAP